MPKCTARQYRAILQFTEAADPLLDLLFEDRVTPLTPELGKRGRDTLALGWRLLAGSGVQPRVRLPSADPLERSKLFVALMDVWDQLRRHFDIDDRGLPTKWQTYSAVFNPH